MSERLQYGTEHLTADEVGVLKDTLELAQGGMFVNWGMNLPLSSLLPI